MSLRQPVQQIGHYAVLQRIDQGTFSIVLRGQDLRNYRKVALKVMKNPFQHEEVQNLRELKALERLSPHPNIIQLVEYIYQPDTQMLALVFEEMSMNLLKVVQTGKLLNLTQTRKYMWQLVKAIEHCHRNGVFHRDIKPENVLVTKDVLKLGDLGSCNSIYKKAPFTEYISTRWYRAPECLLTNGDYTYKMDMWSVGCVFYEIMTARPLFPGKNETDQLDLIHRTLGTPSNDYFKKLLGKHLNVSLAFPKYPGRQIWRDLPNQFHDIQLIDLLYRLLAYDPAHRISAKQAIKHPFFQEEYKRERLQHFKPKILKRQFLKVKSRDSSVTSCPTDTSPLARGLNMSESPRYFDSRMRSNVSVDPNLLQTSVSRLPSIRRSTDDDVSNCSSYSRFPDIQIYNPSSRDRHLPVGRNASMTSIESSKFAPSVRRIK